MSVTLSSVLPPATTESGRLLATLRLGLLPLLALLLGLAVLWSAVTGAYAIRPEQVLLSLAEPLAPLFWLDLSGLIDTQASAVLWGIRLPRIALAVAVGACLGLSGALLQGLFRNPLADAGLIGVSSGAALATAGVIVLGGTLVSWLPPGFLTYLLPLAGFLGGAATLWLVHALAREGGQTSVPRLLLAGVAMTALAGAGIGLLLYLATDTQNRELTFWSLGSLARGTASIALFMLTIAAVAMLLAQRLAAALDVYALGEREAHYLGVRTEALKRRIALVALAATGSAVAFTGTIGFIGLVAPHMVRLAVGPGHRLLLPASALLGAILLTTADTLARIIVAPAELPIGILTALLGVPFFIVLLRRSSSTHASL